MTKSAVPIVDAGATAVREPRPFLYLEPQRQPSNDACADAEGLRNLAAAADASVPALVRSLVDYTIALQNRRALEVGNPQPIQLSVLNRRRRAARAWILAIVAGKVDAATQHAVSTQWMPTLCGTGPDLRHTARPGQRLVEFVRGALTACIFDAPAANLLPHARALHVLESTLAVHLASVQQVARAAFAK